MVCMSKYVLKRLAMLIPVLIGVTFMVYFILSLSPGDTAAMIAGFYGGKIDIVIMRIMEVFLAVPSLLLSI